MSSSSPKQAVMCVFCGLSEDCEDTCGTFFKKEGIAVHYFCMLFSSALVQRGRTSRQCISGFMIRDIKKEAARGRRLRCIYCKKTGATIGCVIPKCQKKFHLPCGLQNASLHQYFGDYLSFCSDHRPVQDQVLSSGDSETCPICLDSVEMRPSNTTLLATCCNSAWMHRGCVQTQAKNAGYFFKCPLCNNKKNFQMQMLKLGIYVPEQDASWELDSNAYGDLLFRHDRCDHDACHCPNGVHHNVDGSRWQIILCSFCGSQGCHIACGKLKFSKPKYECDQCKSILESHERRMKPPSPKFLRSRRLSGQNVPIETRRRRRRRPKTVHDTSNRRKLSLERIRRCLTKRLSGRSKSRTVKSNDKADGDDNEESPTGINSRGDGGSTSMWSSEAIDCDASTRDSEDVVVDVEALENDSLQSGSSADEIEVCSVENDDHHYVAEYNSWRLSPTDFPSPCCTPTRAPISNIGDTSEVVVCTSPQPISPKNTAIELIEVDDAFLSEIKQEGSYTPPPLGIKVKSPRS